MKGVALLRHQILIGFLSHKPRCSQELYRCRLYLLLQDVVKSQSHCT